MSPAPPALEHSLGRKELVTVGKLIDLARSNGNDRERLTP
jgi:hypothetical protein